MKAIQYIQRKFHNLTHPVLGRILMLHRVVEHRGEDTNRELEITPGFLEQVVDDYHHQGCRFVSIGEACDIIGRGRTDHPFVCLTFDDGYRDTFDLAYPILKKHNIPFAVYITTGFIDKTTSMWWYKETDVMNWEQIRVLDADPLCTIGAHTVTHPRLSGLAENDARREIADSKHRLEDVLGHPIDHFSYPHGEYKASTIQLLKEVGFKTSLRTWGGNVRKGANKLLLPRIELCQY